MKYRRFSPSKINTETHPHLIHVSKCWETLDGKYTILFDKVEKFKHLRISRVDGKAIHNFMDIQEIKNDLWGKDVTAIEVYPNQIDFVDGSNTYHLWTWDFLFAPDLSLLYDYKTPASTPE